MNDTHTPTQHPTGPDVVSTVPDAWVVWAQTATVFEARTRVDVALWGTSDPDEQAQLEKLRAALAAAPGHAEIYAHPPTFGATRALRRLPRSCRVVGWLDVDGFRHLAGTPSPDAGWLAAIANQLGDTAAVVPDHPVTHPAIRFVPQPATP